MSKLKHIFVDEEKIIELKNLSLQYLKNNNITVSVELQGQYKNKDVYGILLKQGKKERWWFDDGSDEIMVWDSKEDAELDLEEYVLPNIYFVLEKYKTKNFQINLLNS